MLRLQRMLKRSFANYRINLMEAKDRSKDHSQGSNGAAFYDIDQDFQPIYENFSLSSYLSPVYRPKILSRQKVPENPLQSTETILFQDSHDSNSKDAEYTLKGIQDPQNNKITYKVTGKGQNHESTIEVNFKKVKKTTVLDRSTNKKTVKYEDLPENANRRQRSDGNSSVYIQIDIDDKQDWIKNSLPQKNLDELFYRVSSNLKPKEKEVEYYYVEPESVRNKIIEDEHITIALQGGGVKGVEYVGAYKALLEENKDGKEKKITSIIGSSAGGIIGLAITCEMKPQEIRHIAEKYLSKVTNDRTHPKDHGNTDDQIRKILAFFNKDNYNIIEDDILDLVKRILYRKETQKEILKLIELFTNPSVKKLFTIEGKQDQLNMAGLFDAALMDGKHIELIGIYCLELLEKNPKYAQKFKEIKTKIIGKKQQEDKNYQFNYVDITMSHLYYITEKQFTCTSTDVDDKILRFFNHRTTPDLPVCRAIQMTGAFPVAFKAQRWEKSWGKYYVHYKSLRREISLEGNRFTDGGMLANFPVKFLDNQEMRPMYFSHKKTNKTHMLGFGINGIAGKAEKDQEKLKQIKENLKNIAISEYSPITTSTNWINLPLSIIKGVWQNFNKFSKPTTSTIFFNKKTLTPIEYLSEKIPLMKFGFDLLSTFIMTKDNLTEQCFSHETFETNTVGNHQRQLEQPKNRLQIIDGFKQLEQEFRKIDAELSKNSGLNEKEIHEKFVENIKKVQEIINHQDITDENIVRASNLINYVQSGLADQMFREYESNGWNPQELFDRSNENLEKLYKKMGKQRPKEKGLVSEFMLFEKIKKNSYLRFEGITEDVQKLEIVLQSILSLITDIEAMEGEASAEVKSRQKSIYINYLKEKRQKQHSYMKHIADDVGDFVNRLKSLPEGKERPRLDRKLVREMMQSRYKCSTISTDSIVALDQRLKDSQIIEILTAYEAYDNRANFRAYVQKMIDSGIKKNKEKYGDSANPNEKIGVHLFLESESFSEFYFNEYYLHLREILSEQQKSNKNISITSMTASNYHSLASFLHSSDLPEEKISQEIWKIHNILDITSKNSEDIANYYTSNEKRKQWLRSLPEIIKSSTQKASSGSGLKIFTDSSSELNKISKTQKTSQIVNNIKESAESIRQSEKKFQQAAENSLNFIVNEISNYKFSGDNSKLHDELQQLAQNLAVDINNYKTTQVLDNYSYNLSNFINTVMKKIEDIVKFFLYSSPYVTEMIVNCVDTDKRKNIWMGLITGKLLETDKIKKFVQKNLMAMNLSKDATLHEFYEASSKKITLNFTTVSEKYKCITIINHKTRPFMPVWAAIVATSSLPEFFQPLPDRNEWEKKMVDLNSGLRAVKNYFNPAPEFSRNELISADFLTKLPLDLLTNKKIQSILTMNENKQESDEIFIALNFSKMNIEGISKKLVPKMTIENTTINQLVREGTWSKIKSKIPLVNHKQYLSVWKHFAKIPSIQSKLERMKVYVASHDELIKNIYKQETVMLPIRFNTLDFHLMCKQAKTAVNGQKKEYLSDICEDSIMQAEFIVKEKMSNKPNLLKVENESAIDMPIYEENKEKERFIFFRVEEPNGGFDANGMIKDQKNKSQITLRFLSMLNPSKSLLEKYRIFYTTDPEVISNLRQANIESRLSEVKTEYVQLSFPSNSSPNLYLIIKYPEFRGHGDEMFVQTNYMKIDLGEFKGYDPKVRRHNQSKGETGKFGFVYRVQINKIYQRSFKGQGELAKTGPEAGFERDYRNVERDDKGDYARNNEPVNIQISTDDCPSFILRNVKKVLCDNCHSTLHYKTPSKNSNENPFQCLTPECNKSYPISKKYKIIFNNPHIECRQHHKLVKSEPNVSNFSLPSSASNDHMKWSQYFRKCDVCEESSNLDFWIDQACDVKVCEKCKDRLLLEGHNA